MFINTPVYNSHLQGYSLQRYYKEYNITKTIISKGSSIHILPIPFILYYLLKNVIDSFLVNLFILTQRPHRKTTDVNVKYNTN